VGKKEREKEKWQQHDRLFLHRQHDSAFRTHGFLS